MSVRLGSLHPGEVKGPWVIVVVVVAVAVAVAVVVMVLLVSVCWRRALVLRLCLECLGLL